MSYRHVVVCSGHMIDTPDRPQERFPPRKEAIVRDAMARVLGEWAIGPDDLAVCGGARGADLLFAELCRDRGTRLSLRLALPWDAFLEASVRLPGSDWVGRLEALRDEVGPDGLQYLHEHDAPGPPGLGVFARNNLWIIETARREPRTGDLLALLVWDEKPEGDGPGGTSDFHARLARAHARVRIVNPTTL